MMSLSDVWADIVVKGWPYPASGGHNGLPAVLPRLRPLYPFRHQEVPPNVVRKGLGEFDLRIRPNALLF